MKICFYPKLAATDIRKNRRLFVPYILTCTGMVMMFYIIMYLALSDGLSCLTGAETLRDIFALGSWVMAIFAGIFLFYTNSFLIRRRKKEFGLYNILGMGKGNIARILFWETLLIAAISIGTGLLAGIAFSKLAELGFVNIMHGEVHYTLYVSPLSIKRSVQVFGVIFVLLFLNAARQVRFSSAVSLLRSENAGEKPPRGNLLLGLAGVLLLGTAYYFAAVIRDPLVALLYFFAAVVMVILGTYLVMIAGSVSFCRILQKNKRYYYRSDHFVSVASMAYRMKRNGAGLASICILATMVLVTMASCACLYFGEESAIEERFPREINLEFRMEDPNDLNDDHIRKLRDGIAAKLRERGAVPENDYCFRCISFAGILTGDTVDVDGSGQQVSDEVAVPKIFNFVPLEDYNAQLGADETLEDGEALIYLNRGSYGSDTISFRQGNSFRIKRQVDDFLANGDSAMNIFSSIVLIVPDLKESVLGLESLADFQGDRVIHMKWIWNLDTGLEPEEQVALFHEMYQIMVDPATKEQLGYSTCTLSSQENERSDFYGMFGALFYIGILLSAVFILAAVLIIYYKQISEGYEDQERFEIMQKVGMTRREIRKSINSQLLTVFFIPLAFAVLHLAFAFPVIQKILLAFNVNNRQLFLATTGITAAVFGVFYAAVYRLTSNAYYYIVSGAREEAR